MAHQRVEISHLELCTRCVCVCVCVCVGVVVCVCVCVSESPHRCTHTHTHTHSAQGHTHTHTLGTQGHTCTSPRQPPQGDPTNSPPQRAQGRERVCVCARA